MNAESEIELELELEPSADVELEIEPEALAVVAETPAISPAFVEILPADFPLPALVKFVPNPQLRIAADQAGTYALGLDVTGPEGLERADVALQAVRTSLKAIEGHFAEPTQIANDLHKRLTGIRSDWCSRGKDAIDKVGRRMFEEQRRLDALAKEEQRKAQAEADRQAREHAKREADAAAAAQAPAPVVEELKRQAETVTAPPVALPATAPPALKSSTTVTTWKARIIGTPASDDINPEMGALSPAQRLKVLDLMRAVLDGKAPLAAFDLNWKYLNQRAVSDKSALAIAGIEAFEQGSVRAKGTRSR